MSFPKLGSRKYKLPMIAVSLLVAFLMVKVLHASTSPTRGIMIKKAKAPKRVALVVGQAQYKHISRLKNPGNDAEDITKALRACGFHVISVVDKPKADIDEAIYRFAVKLEKAETGLFFYAGHAIQVDGKNYIVPVDAKIKRKYQLKSQCIRIGEVLGAMEEAKNQMNIVILDACRNNPFESVHRAISGGLAKMNAPRGSLLIYATAPGAVASDGDGRNGIYTSALLKYLQVPGLEIMSLLRHVRKEVLALTENSQIPWDLSSLTGDFYFIKQGHAAVVVPEITRVTSKKNLVPAKKLMPEFGKPWSVSHVELELVPLSRGRFQMGSFRHENDEKPQHEVDVTRDYWMGKHEVTQEQYQMLMEANPSKQVGKNHPVENLTWHNAMEFCKRLSEREKERLPKGYVYRLPTEAEWEYACRAGRSTENEDHDGVAWYKSNSSGSHHPVGKLKANPWGIHDMQGNVWEWCLDHYDPNYYKNGAKDPLCLEGPERVVRGGSWFGRRHLLRSSNRNHYEPEIKGDVLGFRVVLAPKLR